MPEAAQRIVSLLPSATEIVFALGRGHLLRGVSHSCDHPPSVSQLPVLTSTAVPVHGSQQDIDQFVRQQLTAGEGLYQLDLPRLAALAPDVIVTQTLCDVCAVSSADVLAAISGLSGQPLLVELAATDLTDVFRDMQRTAAAIGAETAGAQLVTSLQQRTAQVADAAPLKGERVLFLEWLDPPFCGGHWVPELISLLGGQSCLAEQGKPSRSTDWQQIADCDPDLIVVACCGFDRRRSQNAVNSLQQQPAWQRLRAVREGRVLVGDGNAHFSRAGPRLVEGLEWLAAAIRGLTMR